MSNSIVDELMSGLTRVNHETVGELHGLGTSSTELARHNDFAALCAGFHDEAEDTIASTISRISASESIVPSTGNASPTDGKTTEQLVSQALALGDSRKTALLNLLSVQFKGVFWELESLLDEGSQFTDPASLLAEDFLGMGSPDDNLHGTKRSDSNR